MLQIVKYPKVSKLPIIEGLDDNGNMQMKIYGDYRSFNLALLQYIFVVSEEVVGKFQILELAEISGLSYITIDKSSDGIYPTTGGYLLTNPAVSATSKWNTVSFPIAFEFQRIDLYINSSYGFGEDTTMAIDGNYADYNLAVGQGVFVRLINDYTGEYILNKSTTIKKLFYYSGTNKSEIVLNEKFTIGTTTGFINSNDYKENYYVTVSVETKEESIDFNIRPDSTGLMYFDTSKYLKTKIEIADIFDYSTVSFRDENLGDGFNISYLENYE